MPYIVTEPPVEPEHLPEYLSRTLREIESAGGEEKIWPGGQIWAVGYGSPEGAVAAPVGSLYTRTDGGADTTLYIKESGTSNTGWVAK